MIIEILNNDESEGKMKEVSVKDFIAFCESGLYEFTYSSDRQDHYVQSEEIECKNRYTNVYAMRDLQETLPFYEVYFENESGNTLVFKHVERILLRKGTERPTFIFVCRCKRDNYKEARHTVTAEKINERR